MLTPLTAMVKRTHLVSVLIVSVGEALSTQHSKHSVITIILLKRLFQLFNLPFSISKFSIDISEGFSSCLSVVNELLCLFIIFRCFLFYFLFLGNVFFLLMITDVIIFLFLFVIFFCVVLTFKFIWRWGHHWMVRCMIFFNWRSELYIFNIISGGRRSNL